MKENNTKISKTKKHIAATKKSNEEARKWLDRLYNSPLTTPFK